jgi:hypothetical protein
MNRIGGMTALHPDVPTAPTGEGGNYLSVHLVVRAVITGIGPANERIASSAVILSNPAHPVSLFLGRCAWQSSASTRDKMMKIESDPN